ncbi:MAG: hypothetical protein DRP56_10195, partial [Planctomycetota bacterium]
ENSTVTELSTATLFESPGDVQERSLPQQQLHPAMKQQTDNKIVIMIVLHIKTPKTPSLCRAIVTQTTQDQCQKMCFRPRKRLPNRKFSLESPV